MRYNMIQSVQIPRAQMLKVLLFSFLFSVGSWRHIFVSAGNVARKINRVFSQFISFVASFFYLFYPNLSFLEMA